MDRPWIKGVLVFTFIVSLMFVFVSTVRALKDAPTLSISATAPAMPSLTSKPVLPKPHTAEQLKAYIEQSAAAVAVDKQMVDIYSQQVTAYRSHVDAQITAAKATSAYDPTTRLTAYEKVIKDTLGPLIVTPLLAALVIYSGLKIAGDAAVSRAAAAAAAAAVAAAGPGGPGGGGAPAPQRSVASP